MVHYVPAERVLPNGVKVRCEVCKDGGLLFHRTSPERFAAMAKETDRHLRSEVCDARVLSLSRRRAQPYGGPVMLIMREDYVPGRTEMCYVHPKDERHMHDAYRHVENEIVRTGRHQSPNEIYANMGVTASAFRRECEVMASGCVPLDAILKVEYWLTTSCSAENVYEIDRHDMMNIERTREAAKMIAKPFEIKSCVSAVGWTDETGHKVWAQLSHENLERLKYGEMPKAEGIVGMWTALRFSGEKAVLRCKCGPTPPSAFR